MPHVAGHELHRPVGMYHEDLRVISVLRRRRMDVQIAKVAAERHVLAKRQRLVAEEQH